MNDSAVQKIFFIENVNVIHRMESIENFHFDLNCDFFLGGGGILGYEVKRQYGHI